MYETFILHWAFVTVEKKSAEKALSASKTVLSLSLTIGLRVYGFQLYWTSCFIRDNYHYNPYCVIEAGTKYNNIM
jgi:hypothetical protein